MTNLEAIRANISDAHGVVLSENHFVKALRDVGLVETATYASAALVDRATLQIYDNVLLPGANLSEGSLSYTKGDLMAARNLIAERLGLVDKKDNISRGNVW